MDANLMKKETCDFKALNLVKCRDVSVRCAKNCLRITCEMVEDKTCSTRSRSGRIIKPKRSSSSSVAATKHRKQILHSMTKPLKNWMIRHRKNPYPNKDEKLALAIHSNMTIVQVSNWFANARRRLKCTVKGEDGQDVGWSKRIRCYNSQVVGNAELLSISSDDSIWRDHDERSKEQLRLQVAPPAGTCCCCEDHSYCAATSYASCSATTVTTTTTTGPSEHRGGANVTQQMSWTSATGRDHDHDHDRDHCDDDDDDDDNIRKYKLRMLRRYLRDTIRYSDDGLQPAVHHHPVTAQLEQTAISNPSPVNSDSGLGSDKTEQSSQEHRKRSEPTELPPRFIQKSCKWQEFDAAMVLTNLSSRVS